MQKMRKNKSMKTEISF